MNDEVLLQCPGLNFSAKPAYRASILAPLDRNKTRFRNHWLSSFEITAEFKQGTPRFIKESTKDIYVQSTRIQGNGDTRDIGMCIHYGRSESFDH